MAVPLRALVRGVRASWTRSGNPLRWLHLAAEIAALAVAGLSLAFDVAGVIGLPWQWVALVSISLFAAQVYWRLWKQQRAIELMHQQRPRVTLACGTHNYNESWIDVTNHGGPAIFKAQIEIVEGQDATTMRAFPPARYSGVWKSNLATSVSLLSGMSDTILIADFKFESMEVHYALIRSSKSAEKVEYIDSDSWPALPKSLNLHISYPRIRLRVTISSDPGLLSGPLVSEFTLSDGEGLRDHECTSDGHEASGSLTR